VEYKGHRVTLRPEAIYIALNKPTGYVSSCEQAGEDIILDLIDIDRRIYPIGRLDKDSCGLLLLTNDGQLHLKLSHPSYDHEKEYEVTVARPITDGALKKMETGMPLMGTRTRSASVRRISAKRFRIVLMEGKNRQIRRMVRKLGHRVVKLKRVRIANIKLGRLVEGRWRYLTAAESNELLQMTANRSSHS
jgi:23S rRNA pseudouridine2605 synthase/23S rRNA pseudouridine2604 synthase